MLELRNTITNIKSSQHRHQVIAVRWSERTRQKKPYLALTKSPIPGWWSMEDPIVNGKRSKLIGLS